MVDGRGWHVYWTIRELQNRRATLGLVQHLTRTVRDGLHPTT